jgi:hypothetical protein
MSVYLDVLAKLHSQDAKTIQMLSDELKLVPDAIKETLDHYIVRHYVIARERPSKVLEYLRTDYGDFYLYQSSFLLHNTLIPLPKEVFHEILSIVVDSYGPVPAALFLPIYEKYDEFFDLVQGLDYMTTNEYLIRTSKGKYKATTKGETCLLNY